MADVFNALNAINVNERTEKKKTGNTELTYLSWPFAWAEIKKRYPDAHYEVIKFDGLPYVYDEKTGYMVYTNVTIDGITHEMWLPVMDGANKAMKSEPYEYTTGYGQYQKTKICEAATMFDVNKTIMRCFVKNLAMFGLGLYIYAGEDLPEDDPDAQKKPKAAEEKPPVEEKPTSRIRAAREWTAAGIDTEFVLKLYNCKALADMTQKQIDHALSNLDEIKARQKKEKETK